MLWLALLGPLATAAQGASWAVAPVTFLPERLVAHSGDQALVNVVVDRLSAYAALHVGLSHTKSHHIGGFLEVHDTLTHKINELVVGAELQFAPFGCGVQIMHVLTAIATVNHLLSQLRVHVLHTTTRLFSLDCPYMPPQQLGDVPRGAPPSGHHLYHHPFCPCQMLTLPARLPLFHAVLLPLVFFDKTTEDSEPQHGTLSLISTAF